MVWDYFILVSLVVSAMALYFNTISIIKKIYRGEETFKDTFLGSILFGYIMLCFFTRILSILNHV